MREGKSRSYSNEFKKEIINEVLLNGQSVKSTSLKHGLTSSGLLTNWIKSYRENGYTIVNKPKGRQPRMTKKPLKKKTLTKVEKIKALENELEYLRAQNAYFKKLRVVVEQRKELQKKEKSEVVSSLRHEFPLKHLLKAANLPRSTYYFYGNVFELKPLVFPKRKNEDGEPIGALYPGDE